MGNVSDTRNHFAKSIVSKSVTWSNTCEHAFTTRRPLDPAFSHLVTWRALVLVSAHFIVPKAEWTFAKQQRITNSRTASGASQAPGHTAHCSPSATVASGALQCCVKHRSLQIINRLQRMLNLISSISSLHVSLSTCHSLHLQFIKLYTSKAGAVSVVRVQVLE